MAPTASSSRSKSKKTKVPKSEALADHSKEQIKEFKKAFKMFDVNGDGSVSKDELCQSIRILGGNPTDKEMDAIMSELDKDQSDGIDFEEFVTIMVNYLKDPEEEETDLLEAFQVFDRNGDGVVSIEEIRYILKGVGQKLSIQEVEEILVNAGVNSEGELSYDEFVKLMTAKPF